jgi:hypothetical protein
VKNSNKKIRTKFNNKKKAHIGRNWKKNQFKKLSQTKQIKIKRIGTKIIKIKKKLKRVKLKKNSNFIHYSK